MSDQKNPSEPESPPPEKAPEETPEQKRTRKRQARVQGAVAVRVWTERALTGDEANGLVDLPPRSELVYPKK